MYIEMKIDPKTGEVKLRKHLEEIHFVDEDGATITVITDDPEKQEEE